MEIYDLPKPRSIGFVRLSFWTECLDDRSAAWVAKSFCKIIRVGIRVGAEHYKKMERMNYNRHNEYSEQKKSDPWAALFEMKKS